VCTSPSDRHGICIKLWSMHASTMLFSSINIMQICWNSVGVPGTLTCIACNSCQSLQTSFSPYYSKNIHEALRTKWYTWYLLARLAFTTVFFPHTPNTHSTLFGLFRYRCCCCILQLLAFPISTKKGSNQLQFQLHFTVLTGKVGAFFQVLHVPLYLCMKHTINIARQRLWHSLLQYSTVS